MVDLVFSIIDAGQVLKQLLVLLGDSTENMYPSDRKAT